MTQVGGSTAYGLLSYSFSLPLSISSGNNNTTAKRVLICDNRHLLSTTYGTRKCTTQVVLSVLDQHYSQTW